MSERSERATRASFRRTARLARPATGPVALATLLGVAAAGAGVALLAASAWLISRAAQHPSIADLGLAVVGVRFFAVSRGLFRYGERLVGHDAAFRMLADRRVDVYVRLEELAPSGLPAFHRGDLLARLVADIDALQDFGLRVVPPAAIAAVVGGAAVAVIWLLLPSAAIVLGVTLLLAGVALPRLTRHLARRSEARQAAARGDLSRRVLDLLEGAPELVAYGATDAQLTRIRAADAELTRLAGSAAATAGIGSGLATLVAGLAAWGALIVGIPAVAADTVSGVWLAVLALIPLAVFELVAPLPAAAQTYEQVRRSAARIDEVLAAPTPVVDPIHPLPPLAGSQPHRLRARGVVAAGAVLGVDLDLDNGRRVGLVGPSGAGKSTLAAVLTRGVDYDGGSITLDGLELSDMAGDDVRRVVGLVEQDAHVFDTTLEENLRLARRDASPAQIRDALRRARLLDWVETLPDGLATDVGEHGMNLSGGQRQRLALARGLLADFPILVLDEPGEHLDTATADAIAADVTAATEGRSILLITHRLAGLAAMDEIVVLEDGRVVERGTHDELIAASGWYEAAWWRELQAELLECGTRRDRS